jgi:hypothetical protein
MTDHERNSNSKGNSQHQSSWTWFGSIIIVIGIILIGFNYWHAMKCVESNGIEDTNDYLAAMEKRILDVEYQAKLVQEQTHQLIQHLQERVVFLDDKKMRSIVELSKDIAIQTALLLETQPTPPQTQYLVDDKNTNGFESKWDDLFNEFSEGAKTEYDDPLWEEEGELEKYRQAERNFEEEFDDDFEKSQMKLREENIESFKKELNPEKQLEECKGWKEEYGVVVGVSWGELPYDLQLRWKESECDYYLSMR